MKRIRMERKSRIIGLMPLVMSLILLGCAKDGKDGAGGGDQQVEVVNVRFAFSMFSQHSHRAATRMDSAIVNPTALADGLEDARMLCFNGMPTSSSKKIGEMIEFKNLEDEIISSEAILSPPPVRLLVPRSLNSDRSVCRWEQPTLVFTAMPLQLPAPMRIV